MRVTLVLGGGGVRGIAHVGALRALEEAGVEIGRIVGTSIGGLVGAAWCAGVSLDELAGHAERFSKDDIVEVNRWALLINGIRQSAVFRDSRLRDYIAKIVPERAWSELDPPLAVNAIDLKTTAMEWFGAGGREDIALHEALYASAALPLYYPPARFDSGWYVDGGIVDPLPVRHAATLSGDPIVAIELASEKEQDPEQVIEKGLVGVHHRVLGIVRASAREEILDDWDGPPLHLVRPDLSSYSTWDFDHTGLFMEEGYVAMQRVLASGLGA